VLGRLLNWPGYGYHLSGVGVARREGDWDKPIAPVAVHTIDWQQIITEAEAAPWAASLLPKLTRAYELTHTTEGINTSPNVTYSQRAFPPQRVQEFLGTQITVDIDIDQSLIKCIYCHGPWSSRHQAMQTEWSRTQALLPRTSCLSRHTLFCALHTRTSILVIECFLGTASSPS
jgi:hypothetical protein